MNDQYLTIEKFSEGFIKEKNSKFYSFIYQVENEEEIKEILNELRKKYFDANHHCYAYRLGCNKEIYRANDDGEPSSTAGKPILGQIISYDLTNVLIVVVRYFGGVLLGTGGLISAYRAAAEDAIKNSKIIQKTDNELLEITFNYENTSDVMRILNEESYVQKYSEYTEICRLGVEIRKSRVEIFIDKFSLINKVEIIKKS